MKRNIFRKLPNRGGYKLCISVYGKTFNELSAAIKKARIYSPDLIELRLDFLRNIDISGLRNFLDDMLTEDEILTFRSMNEGGQSNLQETERVSVIEDIIRMRAFIVDIEISTLKQNPHLLKMMDASGTKLIASFHDLKGSSDKRGLRKIAMWAPAQCASLIAIKIVSHARRIEDNLKILGLYSDPLGSGLPRLAAFCSGSKGVYSRILSIIEGSPLAYTALPHREPVASGQLDIVTMRKILSG